MVATVQQVINSNGSTTFKSNQLSSDGTTAGNCNSEVALVDNTQTLISSANPLNVQLQASTTVLGKTTSDLTTPGTSNQVAARSNAYRNGGALHRNAITGVDKLANPSALSAGTGETVASGSLASATGYYYTFLWRTAQGGTLPGAITGSTSPGGSNNALRLALGAPPTGATFADIFLSGTANGPAWVASPSVTQLSGGGAVVTTVGTVATSGSAPANSIDIGVVGTGLASSNALYSYNTAYQLLANGSGGAITPISCVGYTTATFHVFLSVSDLRSLPALTFIPFFIDQINGSYHAGSAQALTIGGAAGGCFYQSFDVAVNGSTDIAALIDTLSGQSAAVTIWVELSA